MMEISLRGLGGLGLLLVRLEIRQRKSVFESQEGKYIAELEWKEAIFCFSRPQFSSVPVAEPRL